MKSLFMPRSSSLTGYTLIELLVVVLFISVLAGIAAPGYVGWVNNQRTSTARSQLADAIRKAQSQARATKINREIRFDNNNGNPRFAIVSAIDDTTGQPRRLPNDQVRNWQSLTGDARRQLELRLDPVSPYQSVGVTDSQNLGGLVFDRYGALVITGNPSTAGLGTPPRIFAIQVSMPGNQHRRCIIVRTLLGGFQEARDGDCPL